MSGNLIDAYIKALSALEEMPFQRAIVQRLLVALNNFQSVPTYPQGDGALDGHSHKATHGYCCYGLKYSEAKTDHQRAEQLVKKFCNDLRRLYEIDSPAKNKYVQKDNDALVNIFGAVPALANRICHVSLIANWFDSNKPLGKIKQNAAKYAAASQCRWITPDADIVLKGPKEFADQYGVDESTMLWLEHQDLMQHLKHEAPTIDLADGPTFDSKMLLAQELLPDSKHNVQQFADLLRADWQQSIAFERRLADRIPNLHAALERGRRQLLAKVLSHSPSRPWETLTHATELSEAVFDPDFTPVYGKAFVRDIASGEVARLVGACPINWKGPKAGNGTP